MQPDCMSGDIFDIRDVIKRFEELEDEIEAYEEKMDDWQDNAENVEERDAIKSFLESVKGSGGDEQWRGDWYPVTFIADSYFERYAQEFADDIGAINSDQSWPNNCIDWERAARELQQDYSSVSIDGEDYWYR